jgi:hypothetical protein
MEGQRKWVLTINSIFFSLIRILFLVLPFNKLFTMKKVIIGSLVGGLLIFIWQTLSHVAFNLHEPVQQYTAKQDSILTYLNKQELAPGGYILPRMSHNQSMEELEGFTKSIAGKPWARVIFYPSYKTDMTMNMVRGFVLDIFMVFLLVWIISKLKIPRRSTIVGVSVVIGLIAFCNTSYTEHIWYPVYDLRAQLIDSVVAWGLCGFWLSRYFGQKN